MLESSRFDLVRKLGEGGMGVVYEAHDRERNMRVALKTLRRTEPALLYHLKREFRVLCDLDHPGVVHLYELFAEGERWFFTMELVEGADLFSYLRGGTAMQRSNPDAETMPGAGALAPAAAPLPALIPPVHEARLRAVFGQLAGALAAVHAADLVHRDLKPSNVLVTTEGRVVLMDFGIATVLRAMDGAVDRRVGTPHYIAPEVTAAGTVTPAADCYSLGVILYQVLTCRLPFAAGGSRADGPRPPRLLAPGVPPDLDELCLALLRARPEERPTARDLLAHFGQPRAEVVIPAIPPAGDLVLGRDAELEALGEALHRSRAGACVVRLLHGNSGMGKTALVRRFLDQLAHDGALVLEGRCYERESMPYKALDSLVDALTQALLALPAGEAQVLVPAEAWALARLFPVLRRLPAIAEGRGEQVDDLRRIRRVAAWALREILARLARTRPVLVFVDDLQWGDLDSANLLFEMLRAGEPPPLLFLFTYRTEDRERSPVLRLLLRQPADEDGGLGYVHPLSGTDAEQIALGPLALLAAEALARRLLLEAGVEPEVAAGLAAAVARESAGNPYFLRELAVHAPRAADLGQLSLEQVLRGRIQRLDPPARAVLEAVALAARPVPLPLVAAAVDIEAATFHHAVDQLRRAHLLRGEEAETAAYHDRVRETVVAQLGPDARRGLHGRLAAALTSSGDADPEELSAHFLGAGDTDRAASHAIVAADRAMEALAFDRAARLYRQALDLGMEKEPPDTGWGDQERSLRIKLAAALASAGRGPESGAEYLEVARSSPPLEAVALRQLGQEQLIRSGRVDEGMEVLISVLRTLGLRFPSTPVRALLSLIWRRAQLRLRGLRFRERPAADVADDLLRCDVCSSTGATLGLLDPVRGADFQTRATLLALRTGDPPRIARALAIEAAYLFTTGPRGRRRGQSIADYARELAAGCGDPQGKGTAAWAAGFGAYQAGAWAAARPHLEQARRLFREHSTSSRFQVAMTDLTSLWCEFQLGEFGELMARVPALMQDAAELGDALSLTNFASGLPNAVWLARHEVAQARREARIAMRRWAHRTLSLSSTFTLQHYWDLIARVHIELYAAQGKAAFKLVSDRWPLLDRSLLLRVPWLSVESHHLRGRAAVAAARQAGENRGALLAIAERDARRILRHRLTPVQPMADLVLAAVHAQRDDSDGALALLERAETEFERQSMAAYAAAARHRRGELLGGDEGRALVAAAEAALGARSVKRPAHLVAMLAPGLGEPSE